MRITPIVLIALMLDLFTLFGSAMLIGCPPGVITCASTAQPLTGHMAGLFVSGDMAHPGNITLNNGTVRGWVNTDTNSGNILIQAAGILINAASTIAVFATFLTAVVWGMLSFPFTLFSSYGLMGSPGGAMFAVILASLYMLLNVTAAIELTSGRGT